MKNNHSRKILENKNLEDVFGAYLLEDAEYDGVYDIPFVDVPKNIHLPIKMVSYSKLKQEEIQEYTYCHFYQKDYTFDGRNGVWSCLLYNNQYKKGFNLDKFDNIYAIICPDFSMYYDMPRVMQIWSVYRSRVFGYALNRLGYKTIPNVRWTDEYSYTYAFSGIRKGSIVAVSTLGCLRSKADKQLFLPGFEELIRRIHPERIILYGSLSNDIERILIQNNQKYVFFHSEIAMAMEAKYGNESK